MLAEAVERISLAEQEGADAPDAQAKAAELLAELETALAAYARDASSTAGSSPSATGGTSASRDALALKQRLRDRVEASARGVAEAALREAMDASGAFTDRTALELSEVLNSLKAVMRNVEAANGSAVLKGEALRDKLDDAVRRAKKQEAKQQQRQRKRRDAGTRRNEPRKQRQRRLLHTSLRRGQRQRSRRKQPQKRRRPNA